MDAKTRATLGRITRNIPAHLRSDLTKEVVDTSEEEVAQAALQSRHISPEKKRKIAEMLEKGAFRRVEKVIDEAKVAELDRYHEREIAKARSAGMLADPAKDPWWQKRMARIRKKK